METVRNTSPNRIAGYLSGIVEGYPLLFEPAIVYNERGYPSLHLKDKSICQLPFEFAGHTFGTVELECIDNGNVLLFSLDIELPGESDSFTMRNDLKLSDKQCISLYEYNIEIKYTVHEGQKMDIIYYDREMITRRHTIENIIK